jgi:hypothetical protein
MTVVETFPSPIYKKWAPTENKDDLRPKFAEVGDLVRVGRRKGIVVRWDRYEGDPTTIAFGFDLEDHPSDMMTFLFRQEMWWEHLDSVGNWAHDLTVRFQQQKRDVLEALEMMQRLDKEAHEYAVTKWSHDEIQEAKERSNE